MSGQSYAWWEQESQSDALLRRVAEKAEVLGRLPTADELRNDPNLPSVTNIAVVYEGRSVENLLRRLAGLLYKRGTQPVDLTEDELKLPEAERRRVEAEYREFYQKRLAYVKEPGGIRKLRKEQEAEYQRSQLPAGTVINRIPIRTREQLRADRKEAAEREKEKRHQWNSSGFKGAAERRAEFRANQETVNNVIGSETERVIKAVSRKIADEVVYTAVKKLKEQLGDFPGQKQLAQYVSEHKGEGVPSWPVIVRVLGSDRSTWQAKLDAYGAGVPLAGAEVGTEAGSSPVKGAQEDSASKQGLREEPITLNLKVGIAPTLVNFQIDGRAYVLNLEFGAVEGAK